MTVEEIDDALHRWAAGSRFSSPSVRRSHTPSSRTDAMADIESIYRRLTPRDAKWFTRLLLKSFEPVIIDAATVYRSYHPSLPAIMLVLEDFAAAGHVLQQLRLGSIGRSATPTAGPRDDPAVTAADLAQYLRPALGTKVGRQTWLKGRSIAHCLQMGHGRMSCEDKIDGEYCQIHVDLSKDEASIQIFSKSGKDSTEDRGALHEYECHVLPACGCKKHDLLTCRCKVLSADHSDSRSPRALSRRGAFLRGSWSYTAIGYVALSFSGSATRLNARQEHRILDFHKIRKHVSRSGSFLGIEQDSL